MSATLAPHNDSARRIVSGYGFWIFLLSDFIMFSALFAAFAVLVHATDGGPGPHELFDLRTVEMETAALLASSFTSGLASIAASRKQMARFQLAMTATGLLGAVFLTLEIREFVELVAKGAGPQRSAFLSAFFTLVGCHGLHVALGLLWLTTMMAQTFAKGFRDDVMRPSPLFRAVLACARHHLGWPVHRRLSLRSISVTSDVEDHSAAPGDESDHEGLSEGVGSYAVGLALACVLTLASFTLPNLDLVWAPSLPVALAVLAIAQMGVHLVFFLHVTSGPDNTNNVMALGFGLLIVILIIGGSLFIMHAMNQNMGMHGMSM